MSSIFIFIDVFIMIFRSAYQNLCAFFAAHTFAYAKRMLNYIDIYKHFACTLNIFRVTIFACQILLYNSKRMFATKLYSLRSPCVLVEILEILTKALVVSAKRSFQQELCV